MQGMAGYPGNLAALQIAAAAQAARANTVAQTGGATQAQLLAAAAAQRAAQVRMGMQQAAAGGGVSQVAQLQAQARLQAQAAQARVAAAQQAAAAQAARLQPRTTQAAAAAAAAAAAQRAKNATASSTPMMVKPPGSRTPVAPGLLTPNLASSASKKQSPTSAFEALLPQGSAAAQAGGTADFVIISTCQHKDISDIVAGTYEKYDSNHGKPVYKKIPEKKKEKFEPLLYFWDKRDGEDNSGWWMGPKVGGDQVWAHHAKDVGQLPPEYGWVIPFCEGEVDPTFSVRGSADGPEGSAPSITSTTWDCPKCGETNKAGRKECNNCGFVPTGKLDAGKKDEKKDSSNSSKWKEDDKRDKKGDRDRDRRGYGDDHDRKRRRGNDEDNDDKYWEDKLSRSARWEETKEEKRATAAVAKAIQKIYSSNSENFDELAKELMATLEKEMPALGREGNKVKVEAERSLKVASDRIRQLEEQKKKMAERLEKAKEDEAKLNNLCEHLTEMVKKAETVTTQVQESIGDLNKVEDAKVEDFTAHLKKVEDLGQEAINEHKACGDFVKEKQVQKLSQQAGISTELKMQVQALMKRLSESSGSSKKLVREARSQQEVVISKLVAKRRGEKRQELFDKYDKDHDGVWTAIDLTAYAREEFSFDLPAEVIHKVFNPLVPQDEIGVSKERFHQLIAIVGIARDASKAEVLRAKREEQEQAAEALKQERERLIQSMRTDMEERVSDAAKLGQAVEEAVAEAEVKAKSIISFKEAQKMDVEELRNLLEEVDALLSGSRERLPDIRAAAKSFQELKVEPELEDEKISKGKMLHAAMTQIDNRVNRVTAVLNNGRVIVAKRANLEFEKLRAVIVSAIRGYMQSEKLTAEALFLHMSAEGLNKESFDEDQWLLLLEKVGTGTDAADLKRLFTKLTEDADGRLTKEAFLRLMRVYNKVVYPSVITSGLCIGASTVERRLEVNEVVEVLEGPELDEESGVNRVFGRAVIDGLEGWMTVAGNQGTVYLEEGGNLYKVVHEVKLTDALDSDKEVRTLRVGEIFEMLDVPAQDDRTDTVRLHGRAKDDGSVGWVTLLDSNRENLEML